MLRGIAKWRAVALESFLFVLSVGVRFGFDAPKRGGWPGEGSPALWGIGGCKVEVEGISLCCLYPCEGAVALVGGSVYG